MEMISIDTIWILLACLSGIFYAGWICHGGEQVLPGQRIL